MNKLSKFFISACVLFLFSLALPPKCAYSYSNKEISNNSNTVNLVIDNLRINELPSHFRKTSDLSILDEKNINTYSLDTLNISGSQQFSRNNIRLIINNINTNFPFIVIDLREESHGFVNDIPVSYENNHNNANMGLSRNKVLLKEKDDLSKIKLNSELNFYNHKDSIIPKYVGNESKTCLDNSLGYLRITATDEIPPSPENIDFFINSVNKLPKDKWLHFHCKEGIGRTSTFMIFYDMMNNYDKVGSEDIINRQIELVSDYTEKDIKDITSKRRITLYNLFYEYCTKYGKDFNVSFSEYLKMSNLSYESYL
ncbi:fused DSP-PTPase phosphatase/NAD kinase-like protein [Clostridium neonatale]|uniref:fused DSP-PTPase phosphatase/NAD kinase-like protein n=1 Tax=Clostridium neonatale TaxID=137838 RepID=UPI00291B36E0|nr:hypothetical protein [Clostridium neonatale]CAI3729716.1 Conserved hypothetical protein [Clostridium neonatale]